MGEGMDSPNKNLSTVRKGKERISWSLLRFGLGFLLGGGWLCLVYT